MVLLERRLDNVVYRLGFASSRREARMLVTQGHFRVNGRKVNIPSYTIKENDVIEVGEKMKKHKKILENLKDVERRGVPEWLSLDTEHMKGTVARLPVREDITLPIQEQLIVELYSK